MLFVPDQRDMGGRRCITCNVANKHHLGLSPMYVQSNEPASNNNKIEYNCKIDAKGNGFCYMLFDMFVLYATHLLLLILFLL
jgi:hypothetical protein